MHLFTLHPIRKYVRYLLRYPELDFAILALVFGLFFILKLAPLSGTDEFTHFPRLYQVSEGTLWEKSLPGEQFGGKLPENINNMINAYRNLSRFPTGASYLQGKSVLNDQYASVRDPGKKQVTAVFTSTVAYPPWAYFPSLIGLQLSKLLHLPLIWYVYLARLSNFLIWLGLVYIAIKLLPTGKWFMVVLALVPTALTQATTIGGDGIQMATAWLTIATTLAILDGKIKANWAILTMLLLVATYSAFIKDGYFLLGLVPLAIPLARFSTKRIGLSFKILNILIVLAIASLFTLRTVHALHGVVLTPTTGIYINSAQQIHYMVHHLIAYAWLIMQQPFTKTFDTTYLGVVGIITNRLIYLSVAVIGILYICLFQTYVRTQQVATIHQRAKFYVPFFLAIFYSTYYLLASAFYIGSTSVGASYVNEFYGRYLLPMLPLLLIIPMAVKKRDTANQRYQPLVLVGSIAGLIATVLSLQ